MKTRLLPLTLCLVIPLATLAACESDPEPTASMDSIDAGDVGGDVGSQGTHDASPPPADAGPVADASPLLEDMGPGPDAVVPPAHDGGAPEGPWPGYVSEIYADTAHWVCHPDKVDGPCRDPLDSTIVHPAGRLEAEPLVAAEAPAVDCFYVYPTCSMDETVNSDLVPGAEELFVTTLQAARLVPRCRVFAPVYRQVTVSGLFSGGGNVPWQIAYADVLDAFKHYMANFNEGRGVVLMGHSQGGMMLNTLLSLEFDGAEALRDQLVAAYILGAAVEVPNGEIVGGTFRNIPLCTAPDDTGCVISYASYRASEQFGAQHIFGRTGAPGRSVACVNPAALAGGPAHLAAYFPIEMRSALSTFVTGNTSPFADPQRNEDIETPFFSVPGLVRGECATRDGVSFLSIDVTPDPEDPRTDDIGGDMALDGWGLHLMDATLTSGDISALIGQQSAAHGAGD